MTDIELAKKAVETLGKLLIDDKLLEPVADQVLTLIGKAKDGSLKEEDLENLVNGAVSKFGLAEKVEKSKLAPLMAKLKDDKTKDSSKEDIIAFIKKLLAERKAIIEASIPK